MRPPQSKAAKLEPQLGIFWLIDGKLIIDSTPIKLPDSCMQ
jgi:hypothetical protein